MLGLLRSLLPWLNGKGGQNITNTSMMLLPINMGLAMDTPEKNEQVIKGQVMKTSSKGLYTLSPCWSSSSEWVTLAGFNLKSLFPVRILFTEVLSLSISFITWEASPRPDWRKELPEKLTRRDSSQPSAEDLKLDLGYALQGQRRQNKTEQMKNAGCQHMNTRNVVWRAGPGSLYVSC